ncbi:MAG: XRE family transcriptional regulator [bacterium]|nr:XRE family transcriptional regulator [bacterium]
MIDDKYIGALIHNMRMASDLTLAIVAERTGLSKGLLSRIENGLVSPPIATLGKIADALDAHISEFFQEDGVAQISQQNAAARKFVATPHMQFSPLVAVGYGRKLFMPFLVRLQRRGFKPNTDATVPGDQFIYVLKGRLDYNYAGTVYRLGPNDCLFFRGEVPHGPSAIHTDAVEYVMILSRRLTRVEPSTDANTDVVAQ